MKNLIYLFVILIIGCSQPEGMIYNNDVTLPEQNINLLEGDILTNDKLIASIYEPGDNVKAVSLAKGFWENGKVYYDIDPNLTNQARVHNAIAEYEAEVPGIEFIRQKNSGGYIWFTPGTSCSSFIGKTGWRQSIILATSCSTGNVKHEIGHALGLWHEQSRIDRDRYLRILRENIRTGAGHNFETYADLGFSGQELDDELDFSSMMLYGSYSFSKNGLPTITKLDGSTYNVNRSYLSDGDIAGFNKLYPVSGEPEYVSGQRYVIYGLTVTYIDGEWWYNSRIYGWCKVEYRNNNWYYSRK